VLATISRYPVGYLTDIVSILPCGQPCSAALLASKADKVVVAALRGEQSVGDFPVQKALHGEQSQCHSDVVPAR
jgi:hypothetical protein